MATKATTPSWSQVKKQLEPLQEDELRQLIEELFKLNADNKVFLVSRLGLQYAESLAEPFRKTIQAELNPARGEPKLNLRTARKAINDFKKACKDSVAVADLMLFYVEQGVICTNNYGDLYESFYSSMESVYEEAAKTITKTENWDLIEQLQPRFLSVVDNTSDIGWGFHDTLSYLYDKYFSR